MNEEPINSRGCRPAGRRRQYDLEERLLEYGARVVRLVERLPRSEAGRHLGSQLLRSGTSPLLNHGEAQAAESRRDFVHKLRICLKELRESRRTLRLIDRVPLTKDRGAVVGLLDETEEPIRIFATSIATAARNDAPRTTSPQPGTLTAPSPQPSQPAPRSSTPTLGS